MRSPDPGATARPRGARAGALIAVLLALPAAAAAEPALEAFAAAEVQRFVDDRFGAPPVVAALLVDGEAVYVAGGRVWDDPDLAPTPDTLFEIGSVTKVFTGVLLSQMHAAGEVNSDGPVTACAPRDRGDPTPITLRHLSTHRSGLPRLPGDMLVGADVFETLGRQAQPYAAYDEAALLAWWADAPLDAPPGAAWAYSNAAVGLLGTCLARAAGQPYAALLRDRVLVPLGLTDTLFVVPPADRPRFADGHGPLGGVHEHWLFGPQRGPWDVGALAPAGALRSTARDLVRFLRAATGEAPASLRPAFARAAAPQATFERPPARHGEMGFGWLRRAGGDGRVTVWHNGGTGGFHSFVGYLEGTRSGVVLLVATGSGDFMGLADRLLNAVADRTP